MEPVIDWKSVFAREDKVSLSESSKDNCSVTSEPSDNGGEGRERRERVKEARFESQRECTREERR